MQHLDEGTIHAWLDGQLPRDEAQRVEAHVAECRQCADAVAEARGLIAASSRILTALDSVPGEVVPKQGSFRAEIAAAIAADAVADAFVPLEEAVRARPRPRRRWFTAVSMAAAAAVVVAIGTVTVMQRSGKNLISTASERAMPSAARPGPSADSAASSMAALRAPQAAPVPAAPPKSLGDARDATAGRQLVATRPNAREERVAAFNEAARAASSDSVSTRAAEPKAAEVQPLSGATPAPSRIAIRGSSSLRSVDSAARPVDQLAKEKDAKQARDTARADRPQQVAADVAKTAAAGVVKGRVTDANNTGLANAMVTVKGTNTGVSTNEAGEFSIGGVQAGSQQLNVRRIGYAEANRDITVTPGQTLQANVVLAPAPTELSNVVVTGTSTAVAQTGARAKAEAPASKPAAPPVDTAPGAPITAGQSKAVGCFELGITALSATRNTFSGMPRRVALDLDIVPANAEGIWYRARDLSKTNPKPNGLWRPTGQDAVEIEWTYGSRTARVRVAGPAGSIMRGNLEEIDRATANGEAANVVAIRRSCEP